MMMPLEFRPGVYRNGTDLMAKDRWRDCNLVRWHEGALRPVGGWDEFVADAFADKPRGMLTWQDNSANRWIAGGTYNALKAIAADGTVTDITPSGLTAGVEVASINTGYGAGLYGVGLYGTPRDDNTNFTEATTWSLDKWGENLVACSTADGKLYEWDLNTSNDGAQITNSPTSCKGLIVTEERFLMALAAGGNPRKLQWSDREDNTVWTPSATNQAGDIELQTAGEIMQAVKVAGQILVLTNVDAYTATFIGGVDVYGFDRVDNSGGVVSRMAAASLGGAAYWMGPRGFFRYSGGVAEAIPSDVSDYVFSRINRDKISHVWAVTNRQFGEVWWFYCSNTASDIDSYVAYNTRENHWLTGNLSRTAGADQGAYRYPLWADETIYQHEFGMGKGDETPHAESGPIMIGTGDRIMWVSEIIPDELTQGDVMLYAKVRSYPNAAETTYGPYSMANPVGVRFQGRQVRVRVEFMADVDARFGIPRLDAREMGRR